ncbi:MAG: dephospho-CoA kinase [Tannerellaceae bacterium]|jgi:dephospho-CoA kinase|nr:dephospho-CoA kinase [Tannerellaceae bacterium]
MRPRIGLTGGIGSGKSVVSGLLTIMGIPVYDADEQSKRLLNSSADLRSSLTDLLGPEIYRTGMLDRRLMAELIFADTDLLRKVNAAVHPAVGRHFLDWAAMQTSSKACAIETAILYESGFRSVVDVSLLVIAPLELRIERAMRRDGSSRQQVEQRMSHQMSDEEKMPLADYVIVNDDRRAVIPQLEDVLAQIESRFGLHNH